MANRVTGELDGYWCAECRVVPVDCRGGYCVPCREAYWTTGGWAQEDDGVWGASTGDPWCAKCGERKVYFKGDWCDDCLPPRRDYGGRGGYRSYSNAGSRLPHSGTWTPARAKPVTVPKVEDEVTYLPAVRDKVTS
ncbi:hypothetical protein SEA_WALTZ_21 [Arthrobacter phage Waltz]|nr:hypothetical protein SEA_WALTZ_21 [Arthrobacter phage Waltz]